MSLLLKRFRFTNFPTFKTLVVPDKDIYISKCFYRTTTPLAKGKSSTSATYQTPFGPNGNVGAAPKQMSQIQNLKLNNGEEIPMLGYGFGTIMYKADSNSSLDNALVKIGVMAIKAGFHHLDGAEVYGNEEELGQAIKESGVPREKLYITTKISGTKVQNTKEAFELSLKKLQLDYVDLYLIHAPFFAKSPEDLQKKWADMEEILASGKAKTIGVSNFLKPELQAILKTAKVVPAVNQIEYHPYLQHGDLLDFHAKHGIATAAYAPLTAVTKAKPGPLDDTYAKLAGKYGVTAGEIALRWIIDQGAVALTTSGNEDRLKDYLRITTFKLTPTEVEDIREIGLKKNFRGFWQAKFTENDFA